MIKINLSKNINQKDIKAIIRQVSQLHKRELHVGFLSKIGHNIINLLYTFIIDFEGSFLILALEKNNNVVGFCAGTYNTSFFYKNFIKKKFFKIFLILLIKIIKNPFFIFGAINIFFIIMKQIAYQKKNEKIEAQLLSIAVSKNIRRVE